MIPAIDTLVRLHASSPPRMAFRVRTRREWKSWQSALRKKLRELSGISKMSSLRCELAVKADSAEDMGDYTRQRLLLQTTPEYWMPMFVLRPKGDGPFRPIIALHGHGYGKNEVIGIAKTRAERQRIRKHNYAYALDAVGKGYIVFAPDKRGFGERHDGRNNCFALSTSAMILGMSVIGMHTWDNQRLLDYIETREDCRRGPIGCIGLSSGGGGTMWLAAMNERIGAAVISGHLAVYEKGLFGCICNPVPHLLEFADRGDLAGLIAPRPLLIESASRDENYSRRRSLQAYRTVKRVYEVAGAPERLEIDLFKGRHEWSGRKAWRFLERWLK